MNRHGKRMHQLYEYVHTNPGCTMMQAAGAVGPNGSLRYGYKTVGRALAAGVVVRVERSDKKGCYRLYTHSVAEWVNAGQTQESTAHVG